MEQADLTQPEEVSVSWHNYESDLKKLCTAKAEDFHLLGYQEVTASEVWKCVQAMTKGNVPLHQWVANIMNLKVGQFMNFMTMSAYRGSFPDDSFDAPKQL